MKTLLVFVLLSKQHRILFQNFGSSYSVLKVIQVSLMIILKSFFWNTLYIQMLIFTNKPGSSSQHFYKRLYSVNIILLIDYMECLEEFVADGQLYHILNKCYGFTLNEAFSRTNLKACRNDREPNKFKNFQGMTIEQKLFNLITFQFSKFLFEVSKKYI